MVSKAEVGRFDGDLVSTLLNKAGITLHEGEGINNDGGEDVLSSAVAIDGETYSIVGNYKQGQEQAEAEPETDKPEADDEGSSEEPTPAED